MTAEAEHGGELKSEFRSKGISNLVMCNGGLISLIRTSVLPISTVVRTNKIGNSDLRFITFLFVVLSIIQASQSIKEKYLAQMTLGRCIGAIAMTEPGTGSDLQVCELREQHTLREEKMTVPKHMSFFR